MEELLDNRIEKGYIEIGDIPNFEGKHSNIKRLDDFGLEVPNTLVVGRNPSKEEFFSWANEEIEEGRELMIRSDFAKESNRRNAPSVRDTTKDLEEVWGSVNEFLVKNSPLDPIVIVQGTDVNGINSDILSANIQVLVIGLPDGMTSLPLFRMR